MGTPGAGSGFAFEGVGLCLTDEHGASVSVLHDITTAWELDGIIVVVGPSGSGKSTLLRLCNRLEVPTAGRVLLDGQELGELDPLALRRRVAMVFQRPVPFAGSVFDNLRVADDRIDDHGAEAVLARVGLDAGLLERDADDLSGGEAQRMCLARSLLTDPEVVLMDEVTSSLDGEARHVVEDLAIELAGEGTGIIWVTHDLAQARRLSDEPVVVVDGTVIDAASAQRYLTATSWHDVERGA